MSGLNGIFYSSIASDEFDKALRGGLDYAENGGTAVTGINFTNWESGGFVVSMSDGTQHNGTVTFDSEGKPTSVTLNGHTMTITLPA